MKIQITFKDADGVYDAIESVAETENEHTKIEKQLESWIEYDEYITIEFDLEKQTATVLKNDR